MKITFQRRITVEGLNLERFIRRVGEQEIQLADLKRNGARRVCCVVHESVLEQLRKIAEQGGWRMAVGERVGAGRMAERVGGRWLLLFILAVMTVGLFMAGQFIWDIEVYDAGAYAADIRAALDEMGFHPPVLRRTLDLGSLRDALEWRYPQAAWVECGLRGMKLQIRLVEGIVGESSITGEDGSCDIVATRTGIVQRIVTRAGSPVVKPGELVQEGDVLIRGEERTAGDELRPVAARGSVYARVWDSAAVRTSLWITESILTGRTHTMQRLITPWFDLWRCEPSEFRNEDVTAREMSLGGLFWPVKLRNEMKIETDIRSVITDYRSVLEQNNHAATLKLFEMTGGRESLVDNWVNWSIIEDEILLSVATGERLMDIGRQERSSGMAATE